MSQLQTKGSLNKLRVLKYQQEQGKGNFFFLPHNFMISSSALVFRWENVIVN